MKRSLFTIAILTFIVYFSSSAQGWRNNTDIYFGQSDYHSNYNSDYHTGQNGDYAHSGSNYYRSKRHYTLSRRDKKKLLKLEKELKITRRKAMRDGFVTRREKRRINNIRNDIARLLDRNSHVHNDSNRYDSNRYDSNRYGSDGYGRRSNGCK